MSIRVVATAVGAPRRQGVWSIAGMETAAFADQPQTREQWPLLHRGCARAAMLLSVSGSARRVNESGTAVCLLSGKVGRPTLRRAAWAVATAITLMAFFIGLGLVWLPLPELVYVAAAAVFVAPCLRSLFRNRKARRRLRELAPPRPWIYVHGVARLPGEWARGAGAEVMSALTDEADRNGWVLVLDAAADGLVSYYGRFGFEACGPAVDMTWGRTVRMRRVPRAFDLKEEVLDA